MSVMAMVMVGHVMAEDFSDAHGCAWDLPKEAPAADAQGWSGDVAALQVTHPKSYSPVATIPKSSLEQQQLEAWETYGNTGALGRTWMPC
eukprot:Skav218129  [mRNA]  locus=scaffold759:326412:326681:- [translate_table: standard]